MMSIRISSFSGCSAGTMIPARLGSASWMMTLSLVRLLRISIRLLPLKPMLIGEPLYSQDNVPLQMLRSRYPQKKPRNGRLDVETDQLAALACKWQNAAQSTLQASAVYCNLVRVVWNDRVVVRVAAINESASHNAIVNWISALRSSNLMIASSPSLLRMFFSREAGFLGKLNAEGDSLLIVKFLLRTSL